MSCPKKNKNCSMALRIGKKNYICGGINKKPTKWKKDNVWLCLKGQISQGSLEMTKEEAARIITVLGASLGGLAE